MTKEKKIIKVIPKTEKDKAKAILVEALMNSFLRETPGLLEDIEKLAFEVAVFNMKWGTKIMEKETLQKLKKCDRNWNF